MSPCDSGPGMFCLGLLGDVMMSSDSDVVSGFESNRDGM